ncbi:protein of unknown function [Hyphomicrobium sp. MC1]|nr:protein of unknown function [Hyphomicrobium sp. MC1]
MLSVAQVASPIGANGKNAGIGRRRRFVPITDIGLVCGATVGFHWQTSAFGLGADVTNDPGIFDPKRQSRKRSTL